MKLKVMIKDAGAVPGGRAILLCDEHGEPLPGIVHVVVENGLRDARVTVTLLVDGDQVAFA